MKKIISIALDFSKMEDRKYAIQWMIDEQMARFEAAGYEHLDLGEERNDLTHFYAHFDNRLNSGIGAPTGITLYVSDDGKAFRKLASPVMIMDSTNSCIKYETEPVSARYVKMTFSPSGGVFVFCSEFLIGAKEGQVIEESLDTPSEETSEEISAPVQSDAESSVPDQSNDGNMVLWLAFVLGAVIVVIIVTVIFVKKKK